MADRGRKAHPIGSHLCDEKWQAHCQKLHKQRLEKMKKRIDNSEPESSKLEIDKFNNPKRRMLELERQTEIDNENRILLEKMVKIKEFDSSKVFKPWLGRTTFQWKPGHYYDPASNTKCVDHMNATASSSPASVHHSSKVGGVSSYKETQQYMTVLKENSKLLKAIDECRSGYAMENGPGWNGVAVPGSRELRWGGLNSQYQKNTMYSHQQSNYRGPEWARYHPMGSPPKQRPWSARPASAPTDPLGTRYTGAFDRPVLQKRAAASAGPHRASSAPRGPMPGMIIEGDEEAHSEYGWSEASLSHNRPATSAGMRGTPPGLPRSASKSSRGGDLDGLGTPTRTSAPALGEDKTPPSPSGSVRSTGSRRSASGRVSGSSSPYLQSALDHQARARPGSAAGSALRTSRPASAAGSVAGSSTGLRTFRPASATSNAPSLRASQGILGSQTPVRSVPADASQANTPPPGPPGPYQDPGMSFGNDAIEGIAGMEDMEHEDLSKSGALPIPSMADEAFATPAATSGGAADDEVSAAGAGAGGEEPNPEAEAEAPAAEASAAGAEEEEAGPEAEAEASAAEEAAPEAEAGAAEEASPEAEASEAASVAAQSTGAPAAEESMAESVPAVSAACAEAEETAEEAAEQEEEVEEEEEEEAEEEEEEELDLAAAALALEAAEDDDDDLADAAAAMQGMSL